ERIRLRREEPSRPGTPPPPSSVTEEPACPSPRLPSLILEAARISVYPFGGRHPRPTLTPTLSLEVRGSGDSVDEGHTARREGEADVGARGQERLSARPYREQLTGGRVDRVLDD